MKFAQFSINKKFNSFLFLKKIETSLIPITGNTEKESVFFRQSNLLIKCLIRKIDIKFRENKKDYEGALINYY